MANAAAGGRLASAEASANGHPRRWWILAVPGAVACMAQLDLFIVNVALPTIGRSYGGASLAGLSWVLNAYAIIFAARAVQAVGAALILAVALTAGPRRRSGPVAGG